jgi:protein ImuA
MLGRMHEIIWEENSKIEDAPSFGFVVALLIRILEKTGTNKEILWCCKSEGAFGSNLSSSGLHWLGLDSHRIIQVSAHSEMDRLWAIEEGLRCPGLIAVVIELDPTRKQSDGRAPSVWRRLQLAAEKNGVTGFILRSDTNNANSVSSISDTRWKITPCPSEDWRPKWNLNLLRVRNGRVNEISVIWDPLTRLFEVSK